MGKAVWEVPLKTMTVTLCPLRFLIFSTHHWALISSIKKKKSSKEERQSLGHYVCAGQDSNGVILLMALVTAGC